MLQCLKRNVLNVRGQVLLQVEVEASNTLPERAVSPEVTVSEDRGPQVAADMELETTDTPVADVDVLLLVKWCFCFC